MTDKIEEFIGKEVDLNKLAEEEQTCWGLPYWEYFEDTYIEFKGKTIKSDLISAWLGSIGQIIYLVNGRREEPNRSEKRLYGTNLLLDKSHRIVDIHIYSEKGDGYPIPMFPEQDVKFCDDLPVTIEKDFIERLGRIIVEEFVLTEEDHFAIEIAENVAHSFLNHPNITPEGKTGIANALHVLHQLPRVTPGANIEFGINYRAGDKDFSEMIYINFQISESVFEITKGGSVYQSAVGSDSFSEPGWTVEIGGYRNCECDLYNLEAEIKEYLNLGAQIFVSDESEMNNGQNI